MATKINFDKKECGRCGGSGQFSYNTMDGSRCYGCGGSGKTLTPAGKKAYAAFDAALTIPAKEVKVGDQVMVTFFTTIRRRVVLSIGPSKNRSWKVVNGERIENPPYIQMEYKDITTHEFPDSPVRLGFNADTKDKALSALNGMKGYAIEEVGVN